MSLFCPGASVKDMPSVARESRIDWMNDVRASSTAPQATSERQIKRSAQSTERSLQMASRLRPADACGSAFPIGYVISRSWSEIADLVRVSSIFRQMPETARAERARTWDETAGRDNHRGNVRASWLFLDSRRPLILPATASSREEP